jgi:integrase
MADRKERRGTGDGLFQRGSIWYIRKDPITRRERSLGTTQRREAERRRAEREDLARDPIHAAAATTTIVDAVDAFLHDFERRVSTGKRSDGTLTFYRSKLDHWTKHFGQEPLSNVDAGTFDYYMEVRRTYGASDRTIGKEIDSMIRVLKKAKRARTWGGDIEVLRPEALEDTYEPRERVLTVDEVTRLISVMAPHRAAYVALIVAIGCRRSEAESFRRGDFDEASSIAHIRGTKTKRADRHVPVAGPLLPLLEFALPYIPLKTWGPLYRDLGNACARAKIAYCSPNDLRRTHSTILEELGVSQDTVSQLLGHTSPALVKRVYGRPHAEALGERIKKDLDSEGAEKVRKQILSITEERLRNMDSNHDSRIQSPNRRASVQGAYTRKQPLSSPDGAKRTQVGARKTHRSAGAEGPSTARHGKEESGAGRKSSSISNRRGK